MSLSIFAVASAHTAKIDSTVSLKVTKNNQEADTLTGKVMSDKPRCESERGIKIFERVDGSGLLAGTTTTDADGNYEFSFGGDIPPGTYYARATRKVLRSNDNHRHVCRKATSKDVDVNGGGPPA